MPKATLMVFLIGVVLHSCKCSKEIGEADGVGLGTIGDLRTLEDGVNFLVVGDWGRDGDHKQTETAIQMGRAAGEMDASFVISTGDNFYGTGVSGVSDPKWQGSFLQIYDAPPLQVPWYAVLGNHDYKGNVDAQLYATNIIANWNMPARYYHRLLPVGTGDTALLLYLDTSPLYDPYYGDSDMQGVWQQDSTAQLAWADSLLVAHANARWKIAVGHHHCYTSGKRADDPPYVRRHLEPLFKKHGLDAYFCGHEHDLQHQKPEGATHYFVSGAGSKVRETGVRDMTLFSRSISGFMVASLNRDTLEIQVVDYFGNILYRYDLAK